MSETAERHGADAPVIYIEALNPTGVDFKELWQHRELIYYLVWREIKVRYKQTIIGAAWAIVQPLMTMTIFTIIFGYFAKLPSDGHPYALFTYVAILPWIYFSQAVGRGTNSLVGDSNLIKKVYFPRLIVPLCAAIAPMIDFFFGFLVLLGMMVWFDASITVRIIGLPFVLILALAASFSVILWLSPMNARYRDINLTIPFLLQVWMYASPVVYPLSLVPPQWRFLYSLNPMVGVIEGFRWALLGASMPALDTFAPAILVVGALLWSGVVFFRRMEPKFADIL